MAATGSLGQLTGSLTMESAAFIRDLGKASNAVAANTAKMNRSFEKVGAAAKHMLAAFVGVEGVRQLVELGKAAIDTGDEIGEAASKLGIGAEALQRFRFAASQTDVDTVALNNAMKQFQKNLATGKIEASTGDIAGAFEEWIAKIRDAPTQLAKVEIAVKAFGKQYQSALLIAAQGEVFWESFKNAHVISDQAIKNASELDNAIRSLEEASQSGFDTGFLEAFTGKIGDSTHAAHELNAAMRTLGSILGAIAATTSSLLSQVSGFLNAHPDFVNIAVKSFGRVLNPIGAIKDALAGIESAMPSDFPEAAGLGGGVGGARGSVGELPAKIAAVGEAAHEATKKVGKLKFETDALGRSLDPASLKAEGKNLFAEMQTPMEEYASSIERLSLLQQKGVIDAETFARAHQNLTLGMASNWLGAAGAVSGALASMFKENKAFAIADVVINTAAAVVSALKNPPGPPFSFVYAAAAAAAGAAQLATIMSAQPGKAGGGAKSSKALSKGSSASASTTAASTAASPSDATKFTQAVTIEILGDVFGPEHFRKIVAGINDVQRDGTALIRIA